MLRTHDAAKKARDLEGSHAFSIPEATKRRKINQHLTIYDFKDGSRLFVYPDRFNASHPDWKGTADDIHLGPLVGVPHYANKQGV